MLLGEIWLTADDIPSVKDGLSAVILIHHNQRENYASIERVKICHSNDCGFYFDQYLKTHCYHHSNRFCIRLTVVYSVARFISIAHLSPSKTKDAAFFVSNDEYYAKVSQAVRDFVLSTFGDTVERIWHE